MRELPSGTVTFLFTDIEGSTRLLHELGAESYAEALAEHRAVLREAFARNSGVEVDTQGDAFFVAFSTAPGAFAAALEAQEALEIPVRMGLHTGTPLLTDEGYVGADVHRAARIAAAGHGHQVLVSAATAALLQADGLRDLGEHRLKDLSAPERIWQLGNAEFPRLKTLYQTNLPVPATPFLGRETELAEASQLLLDGVRLLTLSGPGGTGKTRLALQAAAAAADGYPDGVWWLPLASLADPALVLPSAGELLGAKGDLAPHIGAKRLLLLLDNFEHLMDAAVEVAGLIGACPNLTALVTSRERLQVAGEHEYPVPALAAPDGLELFSARARALGVELEGDEAAPELCERLDNLPLALELAAARTKLFSPSQLLERLGQRLDLFKGGRDADPRQRTLRATIEWSYDLLTPEEQQLFARLSVFAGGCSYEAAEAISEADEDTLQSLLDKSLLRRRDGSGDEPRFWMLETIHEFAAERLEELDESEPIGHSHCQWFLALAERAEPALLGPDMKNWLNRLTEDHDNLRAALTWAGDRGEAELELQIASSLGRFYEVRGHFTEGRKAIETGLDKHPGDIHPALRAKSQYMLARLVDAQGDYAPAESLYEDALETFRTLGDLEGVANSLSELGWVALQMGRLDRARSLGEESIAAARELKDPWVLAAVVHNAGVTAQENNRYAEATRLTEEALALRRAIGDSRGVALSTTSLACLALLERDLGRATELLTEALRLGRELDDPQTVAYALSNLGVASVFSEDFDGSAKLFRESLELCHHLTERRLAAECLYGASAEAAYRSQIRRFGQLFGAAERLLDETGVPPPPIRDWIRGRFSDVMAGDTFSAARTEGLAMSLDDAVACALTSEPGGGPH